MCCTSWVSFLLCYFSMLICFATLQGSSSRMIMQCFTQNIFSDPSKPLLLLYHRTFESLFDRSRFVQRLHDLSRCINDLDDRPFLNLRLQWRASRLKRPSCIMLWLITCSAVGSGSISDFCQKQRCWLIQVFFTLAAILRRQKTTRIGEQVMFGPSNFY